MGKIDSDNNVMAALKTVALVATAATKKMLLAVVVMTKAETVCVKQRGGDGSGSGSDSGVRRTKEV